MSRSLFALLLLLTIACAGRPVFAQTTPADRLKAIEAIYPPWRLGDGGDVTDRGFEFTVPLADVLADFHGSLDNPQLVLFASGNYFFALGELVTAFGDTQSALSRPCLLRNAAARPAAQADGRRRHRDIRQYDMDCQTGHLSR
jgi:hypothetical protein